MRSRHGARRARARQTFDDAGAPTYASGFSFTPFGVPQSGAEPQPFGFTGERHHGELQYLRARWYDAGEGTQEAGPKVRQDRCIKPGVVQVKRGAVGPGTI